MPELAGVIQQIDNPGAAGRPGRRLPGHQAAAEAGGPGDLRRAAAPRPRPRPALAPGRGPEAVAPGGRADQGEARGPAARVLPARADADHPEGAGRGRGRRRAGRAARRHREGRHARGGPDPGPQGAEAARADARGVRRALHGAHLPGLARGPALVEARRGEHRHREGAPGAGGRPLRPHQGQAAHPRVPRGAQAEPGGPVAHPVLRRPARRRQDVARPEHRQGAGPQVRARLPGRRARRGRDPRPPAHLHRLAAGHGHPAAAQGRHAQPRVHARRDGQARRRRLPRRSVVGAARGARSRAERHVPGQLPGGALRPVQGVLRGDGQPARHHSRARCGTAWRSSSCPATRRRRSCRSAGATW